MAQRIERITPEGIVTADGVTCPVDVIVLATGFGMAKAQHKLTIAGRNGVALREVWGDDISIDVEQNLNYCIRQLALAFGMSLQVRRCR